MKDFQQSDKGAIAKSQLTTLLWFLWIWYASRKSSSNTEVGLQIILAEWKLKVWSFSQQCLALADLLVSWFQISFIIICAKLCLTVLLTVVLVSAFGSCLRFFTHSWKKNIKNCLYLSKIYFYVLCRIINFSI